MILVDYSNLLHKGVFSHKGQLGVHELRCIILAQILKLNKLFKKEYGRMIICLDGQKNWRLKYFKYYKWKRKQSRKVSKIDWNLVYEMSKEIESELASEFGYQVIKCDIAEADDVIARLAMETDEKTMICSSDVDMTFHTVNSNVKVYSLKHNKIMKVDNPMQELVIGIVKGQGGKDGIPNIKSPLDTFYTGTKQKSISREFLNRALTTEPKFFCEDKTMLDRYKQNRILIDARYMPEYVVEAIENEIRDSNYFVPKKLYSYFMKKNLTNFMSDIDKF